uniref:PCI domain-containing protein n=1 Tax=Trichuris muris TaxID=70415 RepID=A0A5S6Q363_TRIMR
MDMTNSDTSRGQAASTTNTLVDLENYANGFTGYLKVERLTFVANHFPGLRFDALLLALQYVQERTMNYTLYSSIQDMLSSCTEARTSASNGPDVTIIGDHVVPPFDTEWFENTKAAAAGNLEKLERELMLYRSTNLKTSVQSCLKAIGHHHLSVGDMPNALRCLAKLKDQNGKKEELVELSLNLIKINVYLTNWMSVREEAFDAKQTITLAEEGENDEMKWHLQRLQAAIGLTYFVQSKYEQAAEAFLKIEFDCFDYPEVLSAACLTIYTVLSALASLSKDKLKTELLSNASFKPFLQSELQLSEAVQNCCKSEYASALQILRSMKERFRIDIYLFSRIDELLEMIETRGFILYVYPYSNLDMRQMADEFSMSLETLQCKLISLIKCGKIHGRIDDVEKVLCVPEYSDGAEFSRLCKLIDELYYTVRAALMRDIVRRSGLSVKPSAGQDRDTINTSMDAVVRNFNRRRFHGRS